MLFNKKKDKGGSVDPERENLEKLNAGLLNCSEVVDYQKVEIVELLENTQIALADYQNKGDADEQQK